MKDLSKQDSNCNYKSPDKVIQGPGVQRPLVVNMDPSLVEIQSQKCIICLLRYQAPSRTDSRGIFPNNDTRKVCVI